jgi:hypothetical protein
MPMISDLAVCAFQRLDHAGRHRVVRGEHAVDLRVRLHQVLHHLQRRKPLVVARLGGEQLHVRELLQRVVEAAHAIHIGERAFHTPR